VAGAFVLIAYGSTLNPTCLLLFLFLFLFLFFLLAFPLLSLLGVWLVVVFPLSLLLLGLPWLLLGVFSVGADAFGAASGSTFPLLPSLLFLGVISGTSAALTAGGCEFLSSFGGDATGLGVSLGASSDFFPTVGSDF